MTSSPFHLDGTGYLLVADVETTCLDETLPDASLLEFGAVLCTAAPGLPIVAQAELVIRPPGSQLDHDRIWAGMVPAVREMHQASGLWLQATTSPADSTWSAWEADAALAAWLETQAGPDARIVLAGSGVSHMDQRWLRRHLPRVHDRCLYWTVDASQIRRFFDLAGRDDLVDLAGDVDAKPHRGLADALMHRSELLRYLDLVAQIPPAPRPESTEPPAVVVPGLAGGETSAGG